MIQVGEVCDGSDLAGATCQSEVGADGQLGCSANCQALDLSQCLAPATCGNGRFEVNEICDGEFVMSTCEEQGFGAGTLACAANCLSFDPSSCGAPDTCGNGIRDGVEVCDGSDVSGRTCGDLGFDGGDLGCNTACNDFDTRNCSQSCTPSTCESAAAACGAIADGCGAMLDCGGCDGFLSCGGGGVDNQCGADCVQTCPTGYSCDNLGVCQGGDPSSITFDATAVQLSIRITLNTQPYNIISDCDPASDEAGTVDIVDLDSGGVATFDLPCDPNASIDTLIPVGNYEIFVAGDGVDTDMPTIRSSLGQHTVSQAANLNLDITGVQVSATVTLNGAPYMLTDVCDPASDDAGLVEFVNQSTGASIDFDLPCEASTPVRAFLTPGQYAVFLTGDGTDTDIPALRTSLGIQDIQGPTTLSLNVDAVAVQASLTLNGSPYPLIDVCDPASDDAGTLEWVRVGEGATLAADLPCDALTPLQLFLPSGDYEVFVTGDGQDTEIPVLRTSLGTHTIASATTLTFDLQTVPVSLTVTLNGAPYPLIDVCDPASDDAGQLEMVRQDNGATLSADLPCVATTALQLQVPAGEYEVFVTGDGQDTELPPMRTSLGVQNLQAAANLTLNLEAVRLTAQVTLNGAPYALIDVCDPASDDAGTFVLVASASGASLSVDLPCEATTPISLLIPTGSYEIFVTGDGQDTDIPALRTSVGVHTIQSATNLDLDIVARELQVLVTLNGSPYALIDVCDPASDDAGTLEFVHVGTGAVQTADLPCVSTTPLRLFLPAGIYEVYLAGDGTDTEIPTLRTLLQRIQI